MVIIVLNHRIFYHLGATQEKKKDKKNWMKDRTGMPTKLADQDGWLEWDNWNQGVVDKQFRIDNV